MGDLSAIDGAANTKLVGSLPDGTETNMVKSTANGELQVDDSLVGNTGSQTAKTISAAVRAAVAGSNLAGRKVLSVYAKGGTVFWGFSSSVTPATGFPIYFRAPATIFDVSDGCTIWICASTPTEVVIGESP